MGHEGSEMEETRVSRPGQNSRTSTIRQCSAAVAASLGMWSTGIVLGWSSPAKPDLEKSQDLGELSKSQLSWISSVSLLAALCSCFLIGYLMERIGSKLSSIIMVVPFVIGFAVLAAAQNVWMVILGRIITGFSGGAYTVITGVYISEMVELRLRNVCQTIMIVFLTSGVVYIYVAGAIANWRITSVIGGVVPILHGVAMIFVPETPRYFLVKGKKAQAEKSLQWFRGAESVADVEEEIHEIEASIEESIRQSAGGGIKSLGQGSTLKPCLLSVACMAFQQLAGINAVIFYSVDIFISAGSDIDPNVSAIIVGATQAVCTAFAGILMRHFGRKPLMFISEAGMAICLVLLGVFYYLKENKPESAENLGWLPLTSLVLYMVMYCVGAGPIPWALMGDLCPPQIKGVATAMTASTNWGLAFAVAFSFQSIVDAIYSYGAFWIFAGVCVAGAAFSVLILPETRGKSVDEIMRLFAK